MELFDFQEKQVKELLNGFKEHRAQCLAWYTGAGKTNVFIEMCKRLIDEFPEVKIGISAYLTNEVRAQIVERLGQFGLSSVTQEMGPGVMSFDKLKNIYVFNPQGLWQKDLDVVFDYLIIDEGHAGMGEDCSMIQKVLTEACTKKTRILLVSATPWDTLAQKRFMGIPAYKRPLDQGIADGLTTDFTFHAEEAQVTFTEKDFTKVGDLGQGAAVRSMAILKSACIGKMKHLLKTYDKELGKKVLVICPPGNFTEIPLEMQKTFGGQAFVQKQRLTDDALSSHILHDPGLALEKFKKDPSQRFLFVVYKCQVGFDMKELSSVIDLTMSRNIKSLAQRCGRIARKNGATKKHYFYCYDQSLMKDRLEWLVSTMIDFCLGAYDGWTTKSVKYRKTEMIGTWQYRHPISVTLNEVIGALTEPGIIQNARALSYIAKNGPPTKWTLDLARKTSEKYESRTEMWEKHPALYKWFRLNAKHEMDYIFPLKHRLDKWNLNTVTKVLKECAGISRKDFRNKYPGAVGWLEVNNRQDLKDVYLAKSKSTQVWNDESIRELLLRLRTWSHVRGYGGARKWMWKNGGEDHWKKVWINMIASPDFVKSKVNKGSPKRRYAKISEKLKRERSA